MESVLLLVFAIKRIAVYAAVISRFRVNKPELLRYASLYRSDASWIAAFQHVCKYCWRLRLELFDEFAVLYDVDRDIRADISDQIVIDRNVSVNFDDVLGSVLSA